MTVPLSPTPRPDISPFPAKGDPDFDQKAFDWAEEQPGVADWMESTAENVEANTQISHDNAATAAAASASAAALAAAAEVSAQNAAVNSGAVRWVAGNYTQGDPVWSPISLLTYRRIPAGVTASAVDPANDPAGWRLTGSPYSLPQKDITTALDAITGLPHLLSVGVHYVVLHPLAVCSMPAGAVAQEMVRVTNRSGATTPTLLRNGSLFDGDADDLQLDSLTADKTFTKTASRGWL